jgi:hypothetical protein
MIMIALVFRKTQFLTLRALKSRREHQPFRYPKEYKEPAAQGKILEPIYFYSFYSQRAKI